MRCIKCNSKHINYNGRYKNGIQRYKCCDCKKQFSESTFNKFYRHRFPKQIVLTAVFFHLFIPAKTVQIFIFFLFRCYISKKTICSWTKKFLEGLPEIKPRLNKKTKFNIMHADEKFIKIKKQKAYWWNTTDSDGNWVVSRISLKPDGESAKKLMKKHRSVDPAVDIAVTDGLQSYKKAVKIFGRGCKHVIAGLQEKAVMYRRALLYLSNLPVERIHSRIDSYINYKFRGSFENLDSTDRWRKAFMFTTHLQKTFAVQRSFGTFSKAENQHILDLRELTVPI